MARAVRKKELTAEERLAAALVPEEEQPYKVPGNWCWTYIGAGFDVTSSKRVHKQDWLSEGIPFYRTRELVKLSEYGCVDNDLFISKELYEKFKEEYGIPKLNDLLISGVGTIGVPYIIEDDKPFYFKDGNVVWFKNKGLFNSRYVFYLYKGSFMKNQIHSMSAGTTVDTYTIVNATRTKVPLPPLPEQQRIVTLIESLFADLDEAKEKLTAVVEGFAQRKAAILHQAFTGELTAKWREENGISFGEWRSVRTQDVCEKIVCGKTPKEFISEVGEVPFLKVYNIVDDKVDFEKIPQYIPKEISDSKLKSSVLKPKDVIMNIVGPPLRKIAIVPDTYAEWNMNQAIVRFRPREGLYYRYLYYALINPETLDSIIRETRGVVGQANISVTQSRNLIIKIPSLSEQREIVRILDDLFEQEQQAQSAVETVLADIDTLKKSILARAFRGELSTNNPQEENAVEMLKEVL
ncbi:restriction endonuclease subunit S [Selenomonas sp. AB3002]|uniref:restriction endonuclease subunit S n=1 Tax=Selenomonas sp. AB3002 TaxID=1392502 RepID=UPI00049589E1